MATVRIAITGMRPMPIGRVIIDRITGPIDPSIRLTAITDRAIIDRTMAAVTTAATGLISTSVTAPGVIAAVTAVNRFRN